MTKNDIPADVRRFILTSIASVPHMEALMLVRATAPQRWSAHTLAQRLYVTPAAAGALLEDLAGAGMLMRDAAQSAWFYDLRQNALCGLVERLAGLYASHLVAITVLIHSRLDRKAQQFADAFDLRKDTKDG
jgi:hypothetical protein